MAEYALLHGLNSGVLVRDLHGGGAKGRCYFDVQVGGYTLRGLSVRILDKTFLTEDESYMPSEKIASKIEICLEELEMDTYNEEYVVRVTVDKVDPIPRRAE